MATYKYITSSEVTTNTSLINFTSIPATYNDLVLKIVGRTDSGSGNEFCYISFNSDSGANYSFAYLLGSSSVTRGSSRGNSGIYQNSVNSNNATSNSFGISEIYINGYSKTNSEKPFVSHGTQATNSNIPYYFAFEVGNWISYTAISQIVLTPYNGTYWLPGSSFWLYGISNS